MRGVCFRTIPIEPPQPQNQGLRRHTPEPLMLSSSSHPVIGGVGLSAIAWVLASCLEWPVRAP
jgi:hypothetical protein